MKIALLEDDQDLASLIRCWVELEGHELVHRDNGKEFLALLSSEPVDLLVLDWELPDTTGIAVLEKARQLLGWETPILFSTQRDAEQDIVDALRTGADDYMVKPLNEDIFLARINALGRRGGRQSDSSDSIELGPIKLNIRDQSATVNEESVKLTEKEFNVATHLLKNQGKLLSREYLLKEVWGHSSDLNTRTVDVHISKVKKVLQISPDMGYRVKTIYQHGYRLEKASA